MHRLISTALFFTIFLALGCAHKATNNQKKLPAKQFFLDRYTAYIRDIQSLTFPGNIEEHYSKSTINTIKSYAEGDEITPKDVSWEVQSSYMPVSSLKNSFLKYQSNKSVCLTMIGLSYQKEPMYVNLEFVNQAISEWRIDRIHGVVFTDKVTPEFPKNAVCPKD